MTTTARLTLRAPKPKDLSAFTAFWTSPRTVYMGGPWTSDQAVADFPELARQWDKNGFSMFVVTRSGDDAPLGLAGPVYPETHPEPELGWNLWNGADEGQGLALEAVRAARDWFFTQTRYRTAVSYINVANAASERLAVAVGARPDPDSACPYPPPVLIYRHGEARAA